MATSTLALRSRLLLSLGLATTQAGCFHCNNGTSTDTATVDLEALSSDTGVEDTAGTGDTGAAPEECPTDPEDAAALLEDVLGWNVDDAVLVEQDGALCTYSYTYTYTPCCMYGRPYLDARGRPVEAETTPGPEWVHGGDRPVVSALSASEREALAGYWLENARSEHSSVAGFHRFALDLLAHGAPPALLAGAQRAAAQELRHALDAFTLASAYRGAPVRPAPMDMGGSAPVAKTLAELAAWTARDGAIGETLAVHLASVALAGTVDPAVRAVLETVVRDETEHAELAWATLRWAVEVGGDEVREAIRAVFASLGEPAPHALPWTPALAAYGVLAPEVERAEAGTCVAEVIRPVAMALLSSEQPRLSA